MATIREIAELAGVSRGTVDRVLNGRGNVRKETEDKIRSIAKAVNYRPNRAGIVLAAQKKNIRLGVVVFGYNNPFFDKVLNGVREKSEELRCYNCTVTVRRVGVDAGEQLSAIDELAKEGIHGLAIAPGNDDRIRRKIDELAENGIPCVTLNTDIENSRRIAYVGSNYLESGRIAAGLMRIITSGPVHVGIIAGSERILCHTQRIAGFTSQLRAASPGITVADIVYNGDDEIESYNRTAAMLQAHPEINALYFAAAGVYGGCRALTDAGRSGVVRVVTHDAVDTTVRLLNEGVISATICQHPELQGSLPLDLLFSFLTTGERPAREINYVDSEIRIRENI
ncbi:MAG: LacI family DNA-binding transcriptional regulator [Lachnospiraceae bacterium]|jgi:LacI family transcriptional regulator|nr:LacI family DNA-binding transcriptional regulator [Lachnospiraceae bacterium]